MPRVLRGNMTTEQALEQQILAFIESSIEDTRIPDAIATYADKRAGKPVTKTDAQQLETQLGVPMRIRRQYGMTHVSWTVGSAPNPWNDEQSILLAHADTGVRWPTGDELRKKEPAYFSARDTRNAQRLQLLKAHQICNCPGEPSTIARAAAAIAKIRAAREELEQLLEHDQPLHVVRHPIEKLTTEG